MSERLLTAWSESTLPKPGLWHIVSGDESLMHMQHGETGEQCSVPVNLKTPLILVSLNEQRDKEVLEIDVMKILSKTDTMLTMSLNDPELPDSKPNAEREPETPQSNFVRVNVYNDPTSGSGEPLGVVVCDLDDPAKRETLRLDNTVFILEGDDPDNVTGDWRLKGYQSENGDSSYTFARGDETRSVPSKEMRQRVVAVVPQKEDLQDDPVRIKPSYDDAYTLEIDGEKSRYRLVQSASHSFTFTPIDKVHPMGKALPSFTDVDFSRNIRKIEKGVVVHTPYMEAEAHREMVVPYKIVPDLSQGNWQIRRGENGMVLASIDNPNNIRPVTMKDLLNEPTAVDRLKLRFTDDSRWVLREIDYGADKNQPTRYKLENRDDSTEQKVFSEEELDTEVGGIAIGFVPPSTQK